MRELCEVCYTKQVRQHEKDILDSFTQMWHYTKHSKQIKQKLALDSDNTNQRSGVGRGGAAVIKGSRELGHRVFSTLVVGAVCYYHLKSERAPLKYSVINQCYFD